nr:TonB-dependent receptor [Pontibacter liquoris]
MLGFSSSFANGNTPLQPGTQQAKITLVLHQVPLLEFIKRVEAQTPFRFTYDEKELDSKNVLSVKASKEPLENVLERVAAQTGLEFKLINNNIHIRFPAKQAKPLPATGNAVQTQVTVTGRVTDASGTGLPGVTVLLKGTTTASPTDNEGNYTIKVPNGNGTLVFSFIGYETQEIAINNRTSIQVTLADDAKALDEVVVVGYGTQEKSDLTGAVASVKGEEVKKIATNTPADALQGRVAGVTIRRGTGNPRAGTDINIRGVRSLSGNNPLVIIDGIQGNFDLLNPDDIESIEVLKDGAAAAIYGSLAANGVVIVTTKSGKSGKMKVEFSSYYGVDKLQNKLELVDREGYGRVARMAALNAGMAAPDFLSGNWTANTDWVSELFDNGTFQNYNLTLGGGTENVNYMLSGSYNLREGILQGEDREKKQFRAKVGAKQGRLSVDANVYYVENDDHIFGGSIYEAYSMPAIIPVRDPDKKYGFGYIDDNLFNDLPDHENPLGVDFYNKNTAAEENLTTNLSATFDLFKNLKVTGRAGVENANTFNYRHTKPYQVGNKTEVRFHEVYEFRGEYQQTNLELFANYNKQFGNHNIEVLLGGSRQRIEDNFIATSVEGKQVLADGTEVPTGFLDPNFGTLSAGQGGVTTNEGSGTAISRLSQYGRINYSLLDRYLFQATVRRDGSSKFGVNNRWGIFPSFGFGWKVSEEEFFQVDFINSLKLRGSWGQLGSEATLGAYDYQVNTVTGYRYPFGAAESQRIGTTLTNIPNPNLKWETAETVNLGLDFGLLENRISGSVNYYTRNTRDMIIPLVLPGSAGFNNLNVNFGDVENKGIEVEAQYRKATGAFQYTAGLTLAQNSNKITKVANTTRDEFLGDDTTIDGEPANRSRLDYPIGSFFVYQADGIFQTEEEVQQHTGTDAEGNTVLVQPNAQPGDIRFRDVNGDGQINSEDLVFAGSGFPKFNVGANLSASYKAFDFSLQLYGATGFKIYNAVRQNFEAMDNYENYMTSALDAWTPENRDTDVPRAVFGDPNQNARRNSTRFIEDGNYLRLRNIQLGYTLPASLTQRASIERLRVYVSGQNLFTWTGYSGIDPEVGGTLNAGTDFSSYPNVKTMLLGLQVNF